MYYKLGLKYYYYYFYVCYNKYYCLLKKKEEGLNLQTTTYCNN